MSLAVYCILQFNGCVLSTKRFEYKY